MITDKIENMPLYFAVNDSLKKIYDFLTEYKAHPKSEGRYDLDGERLFVSISSYDTVPADGKLPEAHRKYADVQVMLKGQEYIGWSPLDGLKQESGDFSSGDCGFYSGGKPSNLRLSENTFAVFFPNDAHMPCICVDESQNVTKAVFKILL